jgi:hypothetical protein
MRAITRAEWQLDSEHVLLLKGLLLFSVVAFAFLGAWHYGLVQLVWSRDPTGISIGITLTFVLAAAHGVRHLLRLSRMLNHVEEVEGFIATHGALAFRRGADGVSSGGGVPEGCVTGHTRNLLEKARLGGPRPVDQRLLLETFETDLRRGYHFGWFIADMLLSLGLLGTVIGFILMLGPISGLDTADEGAVKQALASMSGGMAVALYTTLTGLVGGILLKVLGLLLDGAVDELVRRATHLTEVHIIPAIEREPRHAAA